MRHGYVSVLLNKRWTPNHFCASKLSTQLLFRHFLRNFHLGNSGVKDVQFRHYIVLLVVKILVLYLLPYNNKGWS